MSVACCKYVPCVLKKQVEMFGVGRGEELRGKGREFRVGRSQSGTDWLRVK